MEDLAANTDQSDWQNAVAQLAKYGCPDVSSKLSWPSDDDIVVAGVFYEIYMGKLACHHGPVSVKYSNLNSRGFGSITNEVRVASRLKGPNVVPFLGFVLTEPREDEGQGGVKRLLDIGIVSPWVDFSLRRWMVSKENINRCQLGIQVAEAMIYLHDVGVIHGDLRSRSIMVSNEGIIQITGFGSSVLEQDTRNQERTFQFSPRWAAPERFYKESTWPTRKSDIWSLGMVILELLTNDIPYQGVSELRAIAFLGQGRIPNQPRHLISIKPGFKRIIWGLLLSCWQRNPEDRPSANVVRDILSTVHREGTTIDQITEPTHTVIEHSLPLPTIIERLVEHGCSDVTQQLTRLHDYSKWSGGMSDVYQGRLLDGTPVAVKCLRELRNSEGQPEKVLKHTAHELYTWSMSAHPNILELVGLAVVRDRLAMVAPWVEYGSLLRYISANPTADRCNLCTQVAGGLAYMHRLGIAHGDIKGDNIVVSKDGIAKIADFGCATMKREFPVAFTATDNFHYSLRWAAPELFLDDGAANFETDVYALGMTIWETLTGSIPYKDRADMAVIHAVLVRKLQPTRPLERIPHNAKGDELWSLLERCWSYEPKNRPKASGVRDSLKAITQADLDTH